MTHKLTSEEARELSKMFRTLSVMLGDYRFEHWSTLTKKQRQDLEDTEWSLLNAASDMTTMAVGLTLDESMASFDYLKKSTTKAHKAVKKLNTVRKVINVGTSAVGLAAAIMSKDSGAIAKNAKKLVKAATADV